MSIKNLAIRYNQFQNNFGSHDFPQESEKASDHVIYELFAPDFKKIVNGNLVADRSSLKVQLNNVKNMAGSWTIEPKEIIPSEDNKACTVHYIVTTEKAGSFQVIAILKSSNAQEIQSIDEVSYQIA